VRSALLNIATRFLEEATARGVVLRGVRDLQIVGSNAAYDYSEYSDLDLHFLIEFAQYDDPPLASAALCEAAVLFSDHRSVTIRGILVEIYVADVNEPLYSASLWNVASIRSLDPWSRHDTTQACRAQQTPVRRPGKKKNGGRTNRTLAEKSPPQILENLVI